MRRALLIAGLTLASLTGLCSLTAYAANESSTLSVKGISVTPAVQNKVIGPAEKEVVFKINLQNTTEGIRTMRISSADFTALNDTGGVRFLEADPTRATEGNGLSSLMIPNVETFQIEPNTSREVSVKVADTSKLAPGGHYAAIIAQVIDAGTGQVAIEQSISSLVFLETAGQGTKSMNLVNLPDRGIATRLPDEINTVFKATGNTQVVPRGLITISQGGSEVMRGIINPDSSLILPNSTRLLQTKIGGNRQPWATGMYTLKIEYQYDGSLGSTVYEQKFLYVNVPAFAAISGGTIIVLAAAFWWRRHIWRAMRYVRVQGSVGIKRVIRKKKPAAVDEPAKKSTGTMMDITPAPHKPKPQPVEPQPQIEEAEVEPEVTQTEVEQLSEKAAELAPKKQQKITITSDDSEAKINVK